jgi:hypothetical protein
VRQWAPNLAGFSVVEALLSLAATLLAVALVFQGSRMVDSLYRADSRTVDGMAEAKWAFDEMADEVARAGYGMGTATYVLPFLPEDRWPSTDRITLRSNPEGRLGFLRAELADKDSGAAVSGAELFEVGEHVLLTDRVGSESAVVLHADRETLAFRSLETSDGSLRGTYSPDRGARVLGLREVRFGFERTDSGSTLWKEISGGERRVLSRSLETVVFEHLDGHGRKMTHSELELGRPASAIRIHLSIDASTQAASISSLTTAVALGRHSVTIDLPMVTPPRFTDDHLLLEVGPVVESPMGSR